MRRHAMKVTMDNARSMFMPNEIQLYILYGPRWVAFDRALALHISLSVDVCIRICIAFSFGRSFCNNITSICLF